MLEIDYSASIMYRKIFWKAQEKSTSQKTQSSIVHFGSYARSLHWSESGSLLWSEIRMTLLEPIQHVLAKLLHKLH